jgi:hypothetical protein
MLEVFTAMGAQGDALLIELAGILEWGVTRRALANHRVSPPALGERLFLVANGAKRLLGRQGKDGRVTAFAALPSAKKGHFLGSL